MSYKKYSNVRKLETKKRIHKMFEQLHFMHIQRRRFKSNKRSFIEIQLPPRHLKK
jgi:hypothetical protein